MAGALLVAALGGGGVAVALASLAGVGGHTTTVRELVGPGFQPGPDDVKATRGGALSLREIYENDAPGVVEVTSTTRVKLPRSNWFGNSFAPGSEVQHYLGSGFVIDKAGYIVTNYHVVAGAQAIHVSFSNNDSMKATGRRHGPVHRRRPDQGPGELASPQATRVRELRGRPGRRPGRRHRQSARLRPKHQHRHRQRASALAQTSPTEARSTA